MWRLRNYAQRVAPAPRSEATVNCFIARRCASLHAPSPESGGSESTSNTSQTRTSGKREADAETTARPLRSDGALGLRKAAWMRLHPVEKWTVLVDLGRRAPYLLEKPTAEGKDTTVRPGTTHGVLGGDDEQVRFTAASTLSHRQLCHTLPYAVRLHVTVSLLMWIRAVRDVQDTLARTQLPFAQSSRLGKSILTHVFPTRLQEHWVDWCTSVTCKMDDRLNNTAEQIPAPHTWDPEFSETVEDPDSAATLVIGGHRPRHGQKLLRRSAADTTSGMGLVRKVQGITARPSEDDARAAKFTAGRNRRLLRHGGASGDAKRLTTTVPAGTASAEPPTLHSEGASSYSGHPREREGWTMPDAQRKPLPVSLVPASVHEEDARYHGNAGRGEGCPFTDDGRTSGTPIHISTAQRPAPGVSTARMASTLPKAFTGSHAERVALACVQVHAAVFSSLFIEGRTVQLTVDDTTVYAYAQWLLEELIAEKYVTLELVGHEEPKTPLLLPYFPSYAFSNVLALMPPKRPRALNKDDLSFLASSILQAAPCDVLTPFIPEDRVDDKAFVERLQAEVSRQAEQLAKRAQKPDGPSDGSDAADMWRVGWVTLGRPPAKDSASIPNEADETKDKGHVFTPVVSQQSQPSRHETLMKRAETAFSLAFGVASPNFSNDTAEAFLDHIAKALEHNFYAAQLLYLPHNCIFTRRHLRTWVWQRLPANVRLVGVNASPVTALYYYPHASFLPQKVGNLFRYRAVTRSVVARHDKTFSRDAVRYTLARIAISAHAKVRRVRGAGNTPGIGFEPALSPLDRIRTREREANALAPFDNSNPTDGSEPKADMETDEASDALVLERTVDYLAHPSKANLLALFLARVFRI